jgi:hypothetical protein
MTTPGNAAGDALSQAAALAFAMVRFEDRAAHPPRWSLPAGVLREGEECYVFSPSGRRVPIAEVPAFLAGLSSPAMLSPTTTRGIVALALLDELTGDRRAHAQHAFDNQRSAVDSMAARLGLGAAAKVLLQFDDEERIIPLSALQTWSGRFAVQVGWSVRDYVDDERADARMMLRRSDGTWSWGESCPLRTPDPQP